MFKRLGRHYVNFDRLHTVCIEEDPWLRMGTHLVTARFHSGFDILLLDMVTQEEGLGYLRRLKEKHPELEHVGDSLINTASREDAYALPPEGDLLLPENLARLEAFGSTQLGNCVSINGYHGEYEFRARTIETIPFRYDVLEHIETLAQKANAHIHSQGSARRAAVTAG